MHEIVTRTVEGRRLFRPTAAMTLAVLAVLGRAVALYSVQLHAFVYLSNHFHLLATFLDGEQMRGFMAHVNRNTAAAAKRLTGWTKEVWGRYLPIPVLDDIASIRRMQYVLSNGVKEGLVEHPLEWPGPTAAHALLTGDPIETEWTVVPRNPVDGVPPVVEKNRIELSPLPVWARLSREDRSRQLAEMMDGIAERARAERGGRPCLGVAGLRAQDPFEPTPLDDTDPPPIAHATFDFLREHHRKELKAYASAHRRSTRQQRDTRQPAVFPPFGFPAAVPYQGDR
jgi:hypothetical protein